MLGNFHTSPYNHATINKINNASFIQFHYEVLLAYIKHWYLQQEYIVSLQQKSSDQATMVLVSLSSQELIWWIFYLSLATRTSLMI